MVALPTANVFGEDDYVSNGSSRWERRTGSAHTLFVLEAIVAVAVAVAVGFVALAFRPRWANRIGPGLTFAAVLEAIGAWVVLVAFNAN